MGRRGWYAIPGVLALIGIVLVIVGVVTVAGHNAFTLKPFTNGASVQANSDGFGVYSSSPPLSLPTCLAVSGGGTRVQLEQPNGTVTVTSGSQSYVQVARTPSGFAGGTYTVSCTGTGTVGSLATGARGIGGTIAGIFALVGGVLIFIIALAVLLVVFLVLRSRRNRQPPGGPTGYGGGQPYGQQPQYGQPQHGQPPPYGSRDPRPGSRARPDSSTPWAAWGTWVVAAAAGGTPSRSRWEF